MPPTPHDAAGSTIKWRLFNAAIDVSFSVPNSYQFQRNVQATRMPDPCSGSYTLIVRSDGTLGKQFGRPTMRLVGAAATQALADLETAWATIGPFTLVTPTGTLSVYVDPTQGDFLKQNFGREWQVQMGFVEA